jgi:biotin carboxylase
VTTTLFRSIEPERHIMRPVVALFVGARGIRVLDLCEPLAAWADVVVMTARDILAQRNDAVDESLPVTDIVIAPSAAELVRYAAEYASTHRIDGAFTVSEDAIEATAEFAAAVDLPGQPPATMAGFRDKNIQRRALARAGVPVPPFAELTDERSVLDALATVPLPAVLKPTRGSGGALAYRIESPEQLVELFAAARDQVAATGGAVDPGSGFILEELLVGVDRHPVAGLAPYVSVETLAVDGQLHHLAVTDRFPVAPPMLETGMLLPSCLGRYDREQVLDTAGAALHALEFVHGMAHTEIMLTAQGPRVIEVNARVGGALPYLFPMCSDVNLVEQIARVALGLPPRISVTFRGHAAFIGPQHRVGVAVESVDGLAEVAALPGIRAVLPVSVGGGSTEAFNGTLIAAILATIPDAASAVHLWRDVMRTVRPRYIEPALAT